jgi:DNA-binding GntR family transcriptional regulator
MQYTIDSILKDSEGEAMVEAQLIRSLCEQVANRLRADILAGRRRVGEKISEAQLAQHFGISRTPIREAIRQLQQEGLLEGKPNCGVRVSAVSDEIHQLVLPLRATIETHALRRVFSELREEDFRQWEEILAKMEQAARAHDPIGFTEQDLAFHRFLLVRAGKPALLNIWTTMVASLRWDMRKLMSQWPDHLLQIHARHKVLVDLCRSGDRKAALKELKRHIREYDLPPEIEAAVSPSAEKGNG